MCVLITSVLKWVFYVFTTLKQAIVTHSTEKKKFDFDQKLCPQLGYSSNNIRATI